MPEDRETTEHADVPEAERETAGTAEMDRTGEGDSEGEHGESSVTITDDEMGKSVVDESGEELGIVTDVDPDANTIYVDPDPGLTDHLKATLEIGDDEDTYPLRSRQLSAITDDEIRFTEE